MANNTEILRGIVQVGLDMNEVDKGMDELVGKFKGTTKEVKNQVAEMQKLLDEEARLVKARSKTQNPTAAAQYSNKIKEVRKQIDDLKKSTDALAKSEKGVTSETEKMNKALKNAFSTVQISAMKKELKALGIEFSSVSSGAKKFLKETKEGGDNGTDAFAKLKEEIKKAKIELAEAFKGGDEEKILKASKNLADLKNQFKDLSEAAQQFDSSSKFTQIGKSLGNISTSLISLDFEKANKQAKTLLSITQGLTFKEATKGITDLGSTLLNVGKALLLNPIFLIGAAVVLIIQNFEELKKSGGAIGTTFRFIGEVIEGFKVIINELTDALGLTTVALDKLMAKYKLFLEKSQQLAKEVSDFAIAIRKAQGRQGVELEVAGLKEQAKFAALRVKQIEEEYRQKGIARKQYSDEDKKLIEELKKSERDAFAQATVLRLTAIVAAKNKVRELSKVVAEEAAKSKAFDVEFRLKPLSKDQVEKAFELQRQEVARNRAEELRVAALEFEDVKLRSEIQNQIKKKFGLQLTLLKKQQVKAEIDAEKEREAISIDVERNIAETTTQIKSAQIDALKQLDEDRLDIISANTRDESLRESQKAAIKLAINQKYYDEVIKLQEKAFIQQVNIAGNEIRNLEDDISKRKAANLDTTNQERDLAQKQLELDALILNNSKNATQLRSTQRKQEAQDIRAFNDFKLSEEQDLIQRTGNLQETDLRLRKARNSTILRNQIATDKLLLKQLEENGLKMTKEYEELFQKIQLAEQEALKQRRLENISYFESISNAVISGANQVIDAKIAEVDKLNDLQQKRVDDAKDIADQGNAELLELEKKRLEQITKQREKFVRDQQALATIELVANTAITVSKAAAEGGAGAAFTIAAALVALTAGLISAKQIAQNAAFFKGGEYGGEGYTGTGNPTQESNVVGNKPYTYHKREFIFNHQTTDKYLDIFRRIHSGDVDLRQMEQKAKMFDAMKRDFNITNPFVIKGMAGVQGDRMDKVEKLLGTLIRVTNEKEPASFSLDQDGLHFGLMKYQNRKQKIDKLAR